MLDEISSKRCRRTVFRLSRVSANDDEFFAGLNLDTEAGEELSQLLSERIPQEPMRELIDGPFRPRQKLRNRTRFSDGSFPVFYSALAVETAETEVAFHFRQDYAGSPRGKRTAYFQRFSCKFEGVKKDLRPKARDWPELTHKSDYSFCNNLGAAAIEEGIDGLVVPSARHEGANMPIFARQAIGSPRSEGIVAISYSPDSSALTIDQVSNK